MELQETPFQPVLQEPVLLLILEPESSISPEISPSNQVLTQDGDLTSLTMDIPWLQKQILMELPLNTPVLPIWPWQEYNSSTEENTTLINQLSPLLAVDSTITMEPILHTQEWSAEIHSWTVKAIAWTSKTSKGTKSKITSSSKVLRKSWKLPPLPSPISSSTTTSWLEPGKEQLILVSKP